MIFMRSQIRRMAAMIAGSSTVQMAVTCSRITAKVFSPREVSSPSHTVRGFSDGRMRPAARLRAASSAPTGSAAITCAPGASARVAMAVPDSSPPPPTGVMTRSRSG